MRFSWGLLFAFISWSAYAGHYPIVVRGGGEDSFTPNPTGEVQTDGADYDAVVIGGGLAGLTAALYLSDAGKRVVLLEKEKELGGLASGGELASGEKYGRGAAYWTDAYKEEDQILEHVGFGDFRNKQKISEPIDSYFWKGHLYPGVWEDDILAQLPTSFALFKSELQHADDDKLIPDQPIEEAKKLDLDKMSAADWIRSMPKLAAKRRNPKDVKLYHKFCKDSRIDHQEPMRDVLDFLTLYTRSALGTGPEAVSAVAFANFYISEIVPRFTTNEGTGGVAGGLIKLLKDRPQLVTLRTQSTLEHLKNEKTGVTAEYQSGKARYRLHAKYAVFSGQLKFAPRLITDFEKKRPEQAKLMSEMGYANYAVHVVRSKGHPYRTSYDTWVRASDYTDSDFSDVILGRWLDPKINGYEGLRDFKKDPADEDGIFTIYHPLSLDLVGSGFDEKLASSLAEHAVDRMLELFNPLLKKEWGTQIDVLGVETSRWPYSIHLAKPGHFTKDVKVMRKPFGRIYFANNNLGTPAFEEALFRGHCAADNILSQMDSSFHKEPWTRCPFDSASH